MCKKIVVTGASGFVGKALVKKLLDNGDTVYAIVRNTLKLDDFSMFSNLHIVNLHMKDYKFIQNYVDDSIDCFYHLAWNGYGTATNDPIVQYNNIIYSIDAFKAAEKMNTKKFIFTGTAHEFLKRSVNGNMELCSVYGSAKSSFKQIARILAQNSLMMFNSTIFSHVFGEYDYNKRSSYWIIKKLIDNELPSLSSADAMYDWIYIDDAVNGLICTSKSNYNFKDYYIGSCRAQKFSKIIEEVKNVISPNVRLIFGGYEENTYVDYDMINFAQLNHDTGFEIKSDFRECISKTAMWIKNNNI